MIRTILAAMLLATVTAAATTSAMAQAGQRSGTPEEQKACSKDVSRYCRDVMDKSDLVILACLQQNRAKISKPCDEVLVSHGQ
jgi:hypothetical protein